MFPDRFEAIVLWGTFEGEPWWVHSLARDKNTGDWVDIEGVWSDVKGRLKRFEDRYGVDELEVMLPDETGMEDRDIQQMKGLIRSSSLEPYVNSAVLYMQNQGWI